MLCSQIAMGPILPVVKVPDVFRDTNEDPGRARTRPLTFFLRRELNRATLCSRRWVVPGSLHTWAALRICKVGYWPATGSAASGHQRSSCRCALRSVASLSSEPADSGTPACPALMGASAAAADMSPPDRRPSMRRPWCPALLRASAAVPAQGA